MSDHEEVLSEIPKFLLHFVKSQRIPWENVKPKGNTMEIRKEQTQIKVYLPGTDNKWEWIGLEQIANDYKGYIIEVIEKTPIDSPKAFLGFEDFVMGLR